MDACRRKIAQTAKTLACVAVVCCAVGTGTARADEARHAIRLPEWVEGTDSGVRPASFQAAPKPLPRFDDEQSRPRPTPEPRSQAIDDRPLRRLEHAASEARGEHTLTRVIERYRSTLSELKGTGNQQLIARADRAGSWALHARGRCFSERGDHQKAIADYRNAVRANPANLAALHDLGIALADQGENEDALAVFASVLRRSPDSTEALRNRAALLLRTGETESAVVDCDRALKRLKPGTTAHTTTLKLRGTALHASGRLREAARDLDAALQQQPGSAETRVARGNVFAEAGFYEQAIADYEAALQSDPSSVDAYRSLAWVLATCPEPGLRDPDTAIEAAWRARRLLGNDDQLTLDASAAAHAAAGEFGEAIRFQQRLLMHMQGMGADQMAAAQDRLESYKAGRPYVAN